MSANLKPYTLGSIIEPVRIRCGETNPEVVGIDINHSFIPTRANLSGVDTTKYLVVPAGCFACNLMHIGRDERIPLAYNNTGRDLVITPAYYVFRVKTAMEAQVIPDYLYLYLCRLETDRYTWFCTDSSIRGNVPEQVLRCESCHFCESQIQIVYHASFTLHIRTYRIHHGPAQCVII